MSIRPLVNFGVVVIACVLALTAWAWQRIPDGARIPTHWNLQGQINGTMDKTWGLLTAPIMMIATTLLLALVTRIEPRQQNLSRSRPLFAVGWIGILAILGITQCVVIAAALGVPVPINTIFPPLIGLLLVAIGNAMPKTRSNFFVGVRTPWTLESDYSWEKTHRWTGRFFVAVGLAAILAWAFFGHIVAIAVIGVGVTASAIAAFVLSYVFWKRDPERHAHDSVPE